MLFQPEYTGNSHYSRHHHNSGCGHRRAMHSLNLKLQRRFRLAVYIDLNRGVIEAAVLE